MPDTERKELDDHRQEISGTTVHGGGSILLGLPLAAVGIFVVLLSLDVIPASEERFSAPRWVAAFLGGVFFLAGVSFLTNGVAGWRRQARRRLRLAARPGEPWLADHAWPSEGIHDRIVMHCLRYLWATAVIAMFLAPFNWVAFWSAQGHPLWWIVVGVFDLVWVLAVGYCGYLLLRYFKYGTSFLRFGRFPFFLGRTLRATLTTKRPIPGLTAMTVTLRCVEERYETRGSGRRKQAEVVSYQTWADSVTESQLGVLQRGPLRLDLAFDLPGSDDYDTALSERPARYWELEARAETPGVDYRTSFLVPVYAPR